MCARYVVLATAALEQKEAVPIAAASAASTSAAKDASAPIQSENKIAAESETAAADTLDPLLLAEAAQLRRKRLEVSTVIHA
jgi:hypothetical protein